jgi:SAM-dependent methyltransferase
MVCRHCNTGLKYVFLDLGVAPPSNAYLIKEELTQPEKVFPLKLFVCHNCWLVQTEDYSKRHELFTKEYAYFSSVSSSWLDHAYCYTQKITDELKLNKDSFVIEVGSNDGYLLKNFVANGIPCLGIEPTDSTADAAEKIGIPVIREFFEEDFAKKLMQDGKSADLIIGNNVYAHVPDINDFTRGLRTALKPGGTITLEFPHLMNLIKYRQFDTVYHEHYSYLSLYNVDIIFRKAGLKVYNVEELPTHGGSLRVYGCHIEDTKEVSPNVTGLKQREKEFGLQDLDIYLNFQAEADTVTENLIHFLREQKQMGKKVVAYGAAAKGNTLLNYANVNDDLVSFVCDAAPSKQGKFMPGSHIPILHPSVLSKYKPDWLLILPWNLEKEIVKQQAQVREWNGKFVVPIPELREVG